MPDIDPCINAAMFVASQSYSVATYTMDMIEEEDMCDGVDINEITLAA